MTARCPQDYISIEVATEAARNALGKQIRRRGTEDVSLAELQYQYESTRRLHDNSWGNRVDPHVSLGLRAGPASQYPALYAALVDPLHTEWYEALIGAVHRGAPELLCTSAYKEQPKESARMQQNALCLCERSLRWAARMDFQRRDDGHVKSLTARFDREFPGWRAAYTAAWCMPGIQMMTGSIERGNGGREEWVCAQAVVLREASAISAANGAHFVAQAMLRGSGPNDPRWAETLPKLTAAGVTVDSTVSRFALRGEPSLGELIHGYSRAGGGAGEIALAWGHYLLSAELRPAARVSLPVPRL